MELYNAENVAADLVRIEAEIAPHFAERLADGTIKSYEVKSGYYNMNRFWAAVDYIPVEPEWIGTITAHYEILIRDGRIEFQTKGF